MVQICTPKYKMRLKHQTHEHKQLNHRLHMGQYQLLSVLASWLSPLNIDHSGNLPVEICGINYTEKYTNL